MSADAKRGLLFLPTSSASPDFFGGLRPGDNTHANSVVALHAATGEVAWSYQLVHHDVWDYDTPAQPTLTTLKLADGERDVVIQGTKQGFVFVLDRDTGQPVFPVEERAVPQNPVAGEVLSPTQPFPTHVPALVPQRIGVDDAYGLTPFDRRPCKKAIESARNEGLYTPPSEQGTILFPFTGGGINWGGVAFDSQRQVLYANTSRVMHRVTLFPADQFAELDRRYPDKEVSPQHGSAFGMIREVLWSPIRLPCNSPPWGTIAAVDLQAGKILWESTLGTTESLAPLGIALKTGTPSFGGPLVTNGGLVFIGATLDRYLRAFDASSGKELWQGRLPAPGIATPMTYTYEGRQYVVIAAGGRRDVPVERADALVAFALPRVGEAGPTLWSRTVDRPGGRFHYSLLGFVVLLILTAVVMWMRRIAVTAPLVRAAVT
jgi:quinoprotein glucose dehydrogenase